MKRKLLVLLLMTSLLGSFALVNAQEKEYQLTLDFSNLANPGDDHYEGWLIVDGSPVSTGKFQINSDGMITDLSGDVMDEFTINVNLDKATKFVLTLEPSGDTDSTPSNIKLLAGELDSSKMSADIKQNTGVNFNSLSGDYILATPTDGADNNENSGIWFLDPSSGTPAASLDLPDLSGTDWIYEGWVVIDGTALTTGTFDDVAAADDSAPYSGPEAAPPFPGEDYITNAPSGLTFPTDIAGGKAVISVEPRDDNSPAPFQFKPLAGDIPANAVDHMLYSMSDMSSTLPTGHLDLTEASDNGGLPFSSFSLLFVSFAISVFVVNTIRRQKR